MSVCHGQNPAHPSPSARRAGHPRFIRYSQPFMAGPPGHPATDPHMKGLAVDIGHGSNPWLSRDQVVKCFYDAFPNTAYGQQEYNKGDSGEYHYHIQYTPGVGGLPGFSPGIHANGH